MIEYIGEHLWIGLVGQLLIYLAFAAALLACMANYKATTSDGHQWLKLARNSFFVHAVSIFLIIFLIFYMMIMKYYEYDYVWSHVSDSLAFRYTFAAFWEGQEGSFLLWMFWNSVLGLVLLKIKDQWEGPVMCVLSFIQICFVFFIIGFYFDGGAIVEESSSGILGNIYGLSGLIWLFFTLLLAYKHYKAKTSKIYFYLSFFPTLILLSMIFSGYYNLGVIRIGSSPFMLLRDVHFAPIFNTENYLASIEGTGLNPLLQNYWMTIHPPTLFLGFSSTLIPAAYAIAGLWKNEHKAWMDPALKWSLFAAAVLGTGIFMGGVWAYEALSFGGYWAWDPVENASLVPWITLIAGIHTLLVARSTDYSIKSSYFFLIISFILVVYSTFLTRSGILGETSVHAFTEMGLEWQLLLFLFIISIIPLVLYKIRSKSITVPKAEEGASSREFWMFVGALVLLFSAALITFTTSIPVFNAISNIEPFDTIFHYLAVVFSYTSEVPLISGLSGFFNTLDAGNIAPPNDVVAHHNGFQLWTGILVSLLTATVQYLAYNNKSFNGSYAKRFIKYNILSIVVSLLISLPLLLWSGIRAWQFHLLVITGAYTIFSNLFFLIFITRSNVKFVGSVLSHSGFGLLMIGVVFSGALKYPLADPFASEELDGLLGDLNKQTNKNILVPFQQQVELTDGFSVSYNKTWAEGNAQFFELNFIKKDKEGNIIDRFITQPNVLRDSLENGNLKFRAANPDTKHYLTEDIFTLAVPHWAFDDPDKSVEQDTNSWLANKLTVGDTFYTNRYYVIYKNNTLNFDFHESYQYKDGDIPVSAQITIRDINSEDQWDTELLYYIRGNKSFSPITEMEELGLELKLAAILPSEGKVLMEYKDKKIKRSYVVIQALIFPGIQLVWIGSILMMLGLLISSIQRYRKSSI